LVEAIDDMMVVQGFKHTSLAQIARPAWNDVRSFILANTVAIAAMVKDGRPIDDFAPK
jgi:hypothetical protein